mmetsp:Transcript_62960/g.109907  ORF Transcript_62960/g.109907 Transcript_62960/m.109907 type:complete len:265 (-) Transcript_62960:676-1470(-)
MGILSARGSQLSTSTFNLGNTTCATMAFTASVGSALLQHSKRRMQGSKSRTLQEVSAARSRGIKAWSHTAVNALTPAPLASSSSLHGARAPKGCAGLRSGSQSATSCLATGTARAVATSPARMAWNSLGCAFRRPTKASPSSLRPMEPLSWRSRSSSSSVTIRRQRLTSDSVRDETVFNCSHSCDTDISRFSYCFFFSASARILSSYFATSKRVLCRSSLRLFTESPLKLAANSEKEEATRTSGPRMSTMRIWFGSLATSAAVL